MVNFLPNFIPDQIVNILQEKFKNKLFVIVNFKKLTIDTFWLKIVNKCINYYFANTIGNKNTILLLLSVATKQLTSLAYSYNCVIHGIGKIICKYNICYRLPWKVISLLQLTLPRSHHRKPINFFDNIFSVHINDIKILLVNGIFRLVF